MLKERLEKKGRLTSAMRRKLMHRKEFANKKAKSVSSRFGTQPGSKKIPKNFGYNPGLPNQRKRPTGGIDTPANRNRLKRELIQAMKSKQGGFGYKGPPIGRNPRPIPRPKPGRNPFSSPRKRIPRPTPR